MRELAGIAVCACPRRGELKTRLGRHGSEEGRRKGQQWAVRSQAFISQRTWWRERVIDTYGMGGERQVVNI
jgi:hypothetical protein